MTGETLVTAENGQIRIDEIEVGDKVWAYDIFTGETELKEVTKVYVHEVDEILHLHTSCGDIDTTTNHPFYVIDRGWVAAGDLVEGDEVYLIDGSIADITGSEIEKLDEKILVYNLEVADFNTYFIGDVPVLVHNYKQRGSQNENTKSAAAYGREQHKTYDYGGNYEREVPLGSAGRADAVDFDNHIVYELKPDNNKAIRKGWQQLNRYVERLEELYG